MTDVRPPKQTAEFLSFVAQAMGWDLHRVDASHDQMLLHLKLTQHALPESVRRKAAEAVSGLYRQALTEMLNQVVRGFNLKRVMEQKGWTVQSLSQASTVTEATIRKYLSSTTSPREETARKLYNALMQRDLEAPVGWNELSSLLP